MGRVLDRLEALDRGIEARMPRVRAGSALLLLGTVLLAFAVVDLAIGHWWSSLYEVPTGLVLVVLGLRERRNASRSEPIER